MRIFAAWAATALLMAECVSGPETRAGTLEVMATSLAGERLAPVEVELFPIGSHIAEVKSKAARTRVRYGAYRLHVYVPGFGPAWRDVVVDQPETVVRLDLPVGSLGCPSPPAAIAGRVQRDGDESELWVKAVPVRGTGGGESRVGRYGYFSISGLEHTTFIVMVLRGESVLHHQVVRTYPIDTGTTKLFIDLRHHR